jgi:S-adenosylmethionine decarboxylase
MKYLLALVLLIFSSNLSSNEEYQFVGRHLIVSYIDCDQEALYDENTLKEKMKEAALASGVTILSSSGYHFQPSGVTQVLLLSESHASIHTYPEYRSCFVDLFTCGTSFKMDKFDQILSEYLKPQKASHRLFHRNESCEELAYLPPYSFEIKE